MDVISREAILAKLGKKFCAYCPLPDCDTYCKLRYLLDAIKEEPAADVRPVVRAFWVGEKDGIGICSSCKRLDHIDPLATHCRYCGADMRETGR